MHRLYRWLTPVMLQPSRLARWPKGVDLRADKASGAREQEAGESGDTNDSHLHLFNYIDNYYSPYAMEHSVTGAELVKDPEAGV